MLSRRSLILLLCITGAGVALRILFLSVQVPTTDEISFAFSSVHFMESGNFGPTMWYHPRLREILLYAVHLYTDYGSVSIRLVSIVSGVLSIPLLFYLMRLLTSDDRTGLAAAFLLAFEEVHITYSRQALGEPLTVFFILAGVTAAVMYMQGRQWWLLIVSGAAFGLGVASKFHAGPPLALVFVILLYRSVRGRNFSESIYVIACMVILPIWVFLLTYVPLFSRGFSMMEWVEIQRVLLVKMLYHRGNIGDLMVSDDIKAWLWFVRPSAYAEFVMSGGRPHMSMSYSNMVVWAGVLPAVVYAGWKSVRENSDRTGGLRLLLAVFAISYLPMAVSSRPVYLLSSLAVLPFAFGLLGVAVVDLAGRFGRRVYYIAGAVVIISSLYLYPMAIGQAYEYGYLKPILEKYNPHAERPDSAEETIPPR